MKKRQLIVGVLLSLILSITTYGTNVDTSDQEPQAQLMATEGEDGQVTEIKYQEAKTVYTTGVACLKRDTKRETDVITYYEPGRQLYIYSEVVGDNGKWYKTTYGGQWAYIPANLVEEKKEPQVVETKYESTKTVYTTDWACIKRDTKRETDVITYYEPGRQLYIYSEVVGDNGKWYKTTYGGQWAYIPANLVKEKKVDQVVETKYDNEILAFTTDWACIKRDTKRETDVITYYEPDRQLYIYSEVVGDNGKWYKTTYGGQWAYIPANLVKEKKVDQVVETKYDNEILAFTTDWACIKRDTRRETEVITNYEPNTQLYVYSEVVGDNGKWYKTTYGGQWAYIPANLVKIYYTQPKETLYSPPKAGYYLSDGNIYDNLENLNVVGKAVQGEKTTFYSLVDYKGKYYYKISYGGKDGYILTTEGHLGEDKLYQNPSGYRQVSADPIQQGLSDYNLKVGMSGMKVYYILNYLGLYDGVATYTDETKAAVTAFQKSKGLNPTGIVDYETWSKMGYDRNSWDYTDSYVAPLLINLGSSRQDHVDAMVATAVKYIGTRYVWSSAAAPGLGVDCTGLVYQALYSAGMDPKPYGSQDYAYWRKEDSSKLLWEDMSYLRISFNDRQPGDLIYYGELDGTVTHVGLYIGNDQIIEAMPDTGVAYNSVYAHQIVGVTRPMQ